MAGEDAVSYIFGGNTGLTYEQLKRRRAVAAALASQRRGYPKTVGEGMTYLGESIGDMLSERRLDTAEKEYMARQERLMAPTMPGAAPAPVSAPARPGAAPTPIIPPAAPRPPSAPVRPQPSQGYGGQAAPAAPPASAAGPAPSITATPVLPSGPSSEDVTSGPPPSEFAMGGILNAAPLATPNLEPAFPGEEGASSTAGILPSSGYLPPATAAAPPSTPPAPQATAPPAPVGAMDYASWPHGPIRRPTDTAVEESTAGPAAIPAAPTEPAPRAQGVAPGYTAPRSEVENYIRQAAAARGIDPDIAIRVARSEGIANYRSTASRGGVREPSYGPYQLLVGGPGTGYPRGLGNEAPFDPTDPNTWRENVDFALDRARQGGWGPWYGARRVGITGRTGIGEAPIEDGGGNIRLAAYAPDGGAGAPIPGMGGAGSPRLQPQIPPLQGPPPASESEQITPTDIMPMPRPSPSGYGGQAATAQFGPPVGRFSRTDAPVPGVAAAPPPQAPAVAPPPPQGPQPSPSGYGGQAPPAAPARPAVSDEYTKQLAEPTPPEYPAQLSPEEIQGWRIKTMSGGDQALAQHGEMLMAQGKAKREAPYLRAVEEYKVELQFIKQENAARAAYFRKQPETQAELAAKEQTRTQSQLSTGMPAAPADTSLLGTPASPQRSGVPSAGPVPAGVSPQKWGEHQTKIIADKVEAADKSNANVTTVLDRINQVRTHPGKNVALGLQGKILGSVHPDAIGFNALLKELQGTAFLQAYEGLKGTGAISEKEGEKAEQAKARLQAVQSPRDFDKALIDLESTIRSDLERAQRAVNKPVTAWRRPGDNSSFAPDIGQIDSGHRYVGGNPALPSSWVKQ